MPLREETAPAHDVRLTFAPRYKVRRVRLEPEGLELKAEASSSGASAVVPRLDVHAMVVGDLE